MSGIAGIVNLDGAPVDRALLDRMAEFLHYRGPDARGVWTQGSVGLAHTLARTTREAKHEQQPTTLEGEVWITADARLDGRKALIAELQGRGRDCPQDATEPALILHAYAVWGEGCVEHLLGDFSFAIWDSRERKLFCARDHFGIKPFFYSQVGNTLIFSNAMDCLRLYPGLPDRLYEPAIADFLVIAFGHEVDRTVLEAVRRLAPGHVLVASGGRVLAYRYWTLPIDPPTVYKNSQDYVERFRELFRQAVEDRLRTDKVAVLMSGGVDSTSVAAIAKQILAGRPGPCQISAHTGTFDRLVPYSEGRYASLAARALGIPWYGFPLDDYRILDLWDRPELRRAEPELMPIFSWKFVNLLGPAGDSRVVLTGMGGDPVFASLRARHCRDLFRQGLWWQLAGDVARYLTAEGRRHRLYLAFHLPWLFRRFPNRRPYPDWINPDLEKQLGLRERYAQWDDAAVRRLVPEGAVRPEAYALLVSPIWPRLFDDYDPVSTGTVFEGCHPFFDLRLMRYLLSLPALPWCSDKELLRRAMRGVLPDEIRLRPKSTLKVDYMVEHFRKDPKPWLEEFKPVEGLSRYVNLDRLEGHLREAEEWKLVVHLRPVYLNYWLKWERLFAYNSRTEGNRVQTH